MARLFVAVFVIGVFVFNAHAQVGKYSYTDAWGKQGFSVKNQKSEEVIINFSVDKFSISNIDINGKGRHNVALPGHFLPNNEGMPNLPGNGRYIAIPNGAKVEFEIVNSRKEIIQNVDVAPAPRIPLDTDKEPLEYNEREEVYSENAFFPASPVNVSETQQIRGVDAVMLGITPFQYNPVTKELIVYRDLEINIKYIGGDGKYGEERLRNRWWDPILSSAFLNADVLSDVDYSQRLVDDAKDNEEYEYVIIVPNDPIFSQWADSIRIFRNMQGIKTGIVTLEEIGGNSVNDIEGYIDDIYENWEYPPAAVLLIGDYGSDANTQITSPIYDNYCVSDNIFADVDNDHMPDIVFARMTAQGEEDLQTMVTKFINYERNPPTSADFYNHPITALGWQTERWFQICSETVGGFWKNELGKEPVRINAVYGGNPNNDPWSTAENTETVLDYFGPDGLGYIPETPAELGGWNGGSAADVTNAINNGAFMLQHRDHGSEDGWGEPDFGSSDINTLTNTDLTYIFSINCLTGKYNYGSEVFAEKFHRYTKDGQNSGALGILAASEVSYSFVNDTYVWGMYDYMWPEFMPDYENSFPEQRGILPAFASVHGKYFLQQSDWPYNTSNKEVTYHLFHHHGDAFLNVYSEVPQDLTIVHNDVMVSGVPFFEVSADEGSLIALSVEGELLGTAQGTGSNVQIPVELLLPGTIVDVVVTKQNYYRYHAEVLVIPPDGPYVIKDSYVMHDDIGNSNGLPDYGETVIFDLGVKNVGNETATNVDITLTTDNSYVTFSDDSENYGDVAAESTVFIEEAYTFEIADGVPDQTSVQFAVNATDGTEEWLSFINFRANAPELQILSMDIEEVGGNGNGLQDPGETATLVFTVKNNGHASAYDVASVLSFQSPYIQIQNSPDALEELNADSQAEFEYTVVLSENTPDGTGIILSNQVSAGLYNTSDDFGIKVGLVIEDWETGDLNEFEWQNDTESPWVIVTDEVYEGEDALRSGTISHNESTALVLEYDCIIDDSVSFYKKVSSEVNYDYLKFYIDGSVVGQWCGEDNWSRVAFFVSSGMHTFKWEFDKDGSESGGQDCAWIDLISLPVTWSMSAWAGADTYACYNTTVNLTGSINMTDSFEWETLGSGTFSDAQSLTTVYTPSQEDYDNGSVELMLTAFDDDTEISDTLLVEFVNAATLTLDETATGCFNVPMILSPQIEDYSSVVWSTNGDGTFEDVNTVEGVYIPGAADLTNGEVTLSLQVVSLGGCEDVNGDVTVTVNDRPDVEFPEEMAACEGVPNQWVLTLNGVAPWSVKIKNLDTEEVYEFESDENVLVAEVTPELETAYLVFDLMDANGCGLSEVGEFTLVFENPVDGIGEIDGEDAIDLYDTETSEYTTTAIGNATAYSWVLDPVEAGTIEVIDLIATITWNAEFEGESATLKLAGLNSCGAGEYTEKVITVGNTTGEGENGLMQLGLYPNPANEKVRLVLTLEKQQNINLSIVNNIGSLVYSEDLNNVEQIKHDISVDRLAPGVYHVIIRGNNVNAVRKLVVE